MDCIIIEILSEPFEMHGKWWRTVKWVSWGCRGRCNIEFKSKSLAFDCRVKHTFKRQQETISRDPIAALFQA